MPEQPIAAENITAQYEDHQLLTASPNATIPWEDARDRLAAHQFYWFASVRPSGHPHVRPVLAVWVGGALYTTSGPGTRKARNLADNPQSTVTASTDGLDLVVEGTAAPVSEPATLQDVAEAYRTKYGWPVTLRDGAFDAPYGAPTAGPPPYQPYAITPTIIYGLGTNEPYAPRSTRWRFT